MKLKSHGKDEMYTTWYECPSCLDNNVFQYANNCPNCGASVKEFWAETLEKPLTNSQE